MRTSTPCHRRVPTMAMTGRAACRTLRAKTRARGMEFGIKCSYPHRFKSTVYLWEACSPTCCVSSKKSTANPWSKMRRKLTSSHQSGVAPSAAPRLERGHLVARRLYGIRRGTVREMEDADCTAEGPRGRGRPRVGHAPWLTSSSTGESGAFLPRSAYPASTRCTKLTPTRAETVDGVAEAVDPRGLPIYSPDLILSFSRRVRRLSGAYIGDR